MKTLLVCIVSIASVSCFGQKEIPAAAQKAFLAKFPNTHVQKWDVEDGSYEANFKMNGKTMSATFTADGIWKETETDIHTSELPAATAEYIKEHYAGKKIKEAAYIETGNGNMYEAEIDGKDILFDSSGKFIKEEKDED